MGGRPVYRRTRTTQSGKDGSGQNAAGRNADQPGGDPANTDTANTDPSNTSVLGSGPHDLDDPYAAYLQWLSAGKPGAPRPEHGDEHTDDDDTTPHAPIDSKSVHEHVQMHDTRPTRAGDPSSRFKAISALLAKWRRHPG
ncbi:hypothetical protein [Herbiconiux daphne]|uniref:Uncharacterized protein n=1 Tax=Herbiconiux daphne TaxID=2970914 RepID=A0ABT2H873_9MICO|nr:hypothetical protein [Herbiconiux daphne]MCS5736128.1 hypothetical protein [Herbiconiux daphne]